MELNMNEVAEYIYKKMNGLVSIDTINDILDLEYAYLEENGFTETPTDGFEEEDLLG
jgi:hypothetical protein